MNIDLTFDSSTNNAPSGFFAAMNAVAQYYDSIITSPITVNIQVGYGQIDGQPLSQGALGESDTFFNSQQQPYSYATIRSALISSAAAGASTLPASDPVGNGGYFVATAEQKAIGLMGPSSALDGFIGFASQGVAWTYNTTNGASVAPGTYDFFGVAAHEISEVLGRELFVGSSDQGFGPNTYTPLDLFHYSSNGTRDFQGTTPGYFSVNGGATDLDNFNTNTSGDFGDWANSAGNDAFRAFLNSGVPNPVSQADLTELSALGYSENTPATVPGNIGFAGNFAGNGYADIVWQNTSTGTVTMWTNSAGTIPSGSTVFSSVPASWRVVGVGDFNGDGKSDIMWQSTDGTPGIWEMNGTTPIAEAAFPAPAGWTVVGTGDFAGSGKSGLVWQSGSSIGVWLMNGTTPTAETAFAGPGANWNVVGTADLTNNGRDDILLQNSTTGNLTIEFMNGTSVTSSSTITVGDPSWRVAATGRENGDAAIIWQNTNGEAGIWLMNGATPVAEAGLLNAGTGWQIIGTGDFNNDGNSDLLFYNAAANQSAIWLMNGTHIQAESVLQASMGSAASTPTAANPLATAPVLSAADVYYAATSQASSTPSAGVSSLVQQQLATPTTTGLGSFQLTQT